MKRTKIKGTSAVHNTGSSQSYPDFYRMPFLPEIQTARKPHAVRQAPEIVPSHVRLLRGENSLLNDCAVLLSSGSQILPASPRPATVAALTNQLFIERAMMLKAPQSLSIVQSVLNQHPEALMSAMTDVRQHSPFDSSLLLGVSNATGPNALWSLPATAHPLFTHDSSTFLDPTPPTLLDPAVLVILRQMSSRRWDL